MGGVEHVMEEVTVKYDWIYVAEVDINGTCFFNEQCEIRVQQTECKDARCSCRFEMVASFNNKLNKYECARGSLTVKTQSRQSVVKCPSRQMSSSTSGEALRSTQPQCEIRSVIKLQTT
ncbi:hypothetical protein AAG570_000861 [Ranatra chinensis]|uniref:EB domain-containing protein n=1 Tax=Ranatra chinensis TaxID=642074 RepID=A0ABD0ZJI9_9HEMI